MDHSNTSMSMMGHLAFEKLNDLCRNNPEIFSVHSSPDAETLAEFDKEFSETDYVKGLYEFGELERAIKSLDRNYSTSGIHIKSLSMTKSEWRALQEQKRRERKVRFIRRLAEVLGPQDRPLEILSLADQKSNRARALVSLTKAHEALRRILRDEFFKESITPVGNLALLLRLEGEMPEAVQAIKKAQPQYPFERVRIDDLDGSRARKLVNRLADVCYRIYGCCDDKIIVNLAGYVWVGYIDRHPDIRAGIEEALNRKVDQFKRRLPKEDYDETDLQGDWPPAVTMNPPWMEA